MLENKRENQGFREDLNFQRGKLEAQINKNKKKLKGIQRIEIDIWHYFTADDITLGQVTKLAWKYRKILILRRRIKEAISKDEKLIEAIVKMLEAYNSTNGTVKDYQPHFMGMKKMLEIDFDGTWIMEQIDLLDAEDENIEKLVSEAMGE